MGSGLKNDYQVPPVFQSLYPWRVLQEDVTLKKSVIARFLQRTDY